MSITQAATASPTRRARPVPSPAVLGPAGRAVGAACLVLGAACFTAAEAITAEGSSDPATILSSYAANPGSVNAGIVLSFLSAVFFLGGLFAVSARRLTRGRVILPIGLALALWAMLADTLLLGVNVAFLAMSSPGLDRGAMIQAVDAVMKAPLGPLALTGHYLLVVAFLLVGIGFWRAGIGPRWAAAFVALCGVADAVAGALGPVGDVVGTVASDAMMLAGFGAVAWFLLREQVRGAGARQAD